jgi:TRAP-type C4-dicarboxylate transport system permease large subunit
MYSHLYVFVIDHVFVKVRTMYEQAIASADPPLALQLFVEALVATVAKDST